MNNYRYTTQNDLHGNYTNINESQFVHFISESGSSSVSTSSSSSETDSFFDLRSIDTTLALQIIQLTMMKYGPIKFVAEYPDMNFSSFDRFLKSSIVEVLSDKEQYDKGIHDYLKKSLLPYFPYENDQYLNYQWVNNFCMSRSDKDIVSLAYDFSNTAEKMALIIINEKNIPNYLKTIKSSDVGGKAGGLKFISSGILFKFASDFELAKNEWLYGRTKRNDILASKALDNELKALRAMFECRKILNLRIKIPLMCTINYLGFTVCAVSLLPISDTSLCYGSCDAGNTIEDGMDDVLLLKEIRQISAYFNLETHPVQDNKGYIKELEFAADVEIHAFQNDYFMLDFGRFLPPNSPSEPLIHMFRYEYMKKSKQRISPDAFLGFGRIDSDHYNHKALEKIIELEEEITHFSKTFMLSIFDGDVLKEKLHQEGYNLRFLGKIRQIIMHEKLSVQTISPSPVKKKGKKFFSKGKRNKSTITVQDMTDQYILMEMILRTLKSILQNQLYNRKAHSLIPNETQCREVVVDFYKSILDKKSNIWIDPSGIKAMVMLKFDHGLSDHELEHSYCLLDALSEDNKIKLFELVPRYCNFTGGFFTYDTTLTCKTKASIPYLIKEEIVNDLISSTSHNSYATMELWNIRNDVGFKNKNLIHYLALCLITFKEEMDKLYFYRDFIIMNTHRLYGQYPEEMNILLNTILVLQKDYPLFLKEFFFTMFYYRVNFVYLGPVHIFVKKTISDNDIANVIMRTNVTNELHIYGCELISDQGLHQIQTQINLTSLSINYCDGLSNDCLQYLSYFTGLTSLNLDNFRQMDNTGMKLVSKVNTLEHLFIRNIPDLDFNINFTYLKRLKRLQTLDLYFCQSLSDDDIPTIASLTELTYLDILKTDVSSQKLSYLSSLVKLKTINLGSAKITQFNFAIETLREIRLLGSASVDDESLMITLSTGNFDIISVPQQRLMTNRSVDAISLNSGLTQLIINESLITDQGLKNFYRLTNLTSLDLSYTPITNRALSYINSCPLKDLTLTQTDITDDGLDHLKEVYTIEFLVLERTKITDRGLIYILHLNFIEINLINCNITEKGLKSISHIPNILHFKK